MRNPTASEIGKAVIRQMQRHRGITLIELMVVVVIIGILAGIAYPSYTRYVTDTRRSEGQRLLFLAAAQQEKFYTHCGYYASTFALNNATPNTCGAGAGNGVLGMMRTLSDVTHYSLDTPIVPAPAPPAGLTINNSFRLTATALTTQATNDTDCANLTIDSRGVKFQTGPNAQGRCWRR